MKAHAVLTPMLMALFLIAGDFITMSLTTDRATPSPMPDAWRIRKITAAAAFLGLFGLTFAVGVVTAGKYVLRFGIAELRTLAFVTLVFANQATVYVVRDRGHMWHSRPGRWLVLSSLLDMAIATSLATPARSWRPCPLQWSRRYSPARRRFPSPWARSSMPRSSASTSHEGIDRPRHCRRASNRTATPDRRSDSTSGRFDAKLHGRGAGTGVCGKAREAHVLRPC